MNCAWCLRLIRAQHPTVLVSEEGEGYYMAVMHRECWGEVVRLRNAQALRDMPTTGSVN